MKKSTPQRKTLSKIVFCICAFGLLLTACSSTKPKQKKQKEQKKGSVSIISSETPARVVENENSL